MTLIRKKSIANIAKNIKEIRLQQGLKQKDFADLLEMNYQNYSKMERGVYTPSLDKLLDICSILYISPNDLLLEGREFDNYKKQIFENLDASIVDITDTMKTVEQERMKALIAKKDKNEKAERASLNAIIGMFAWRNEHYWEIADFLYYKKLNEYIKKSSDSTLKELMEKIDK